MNVQAIKNGNRLATNIVSHQMDPMVNEATRTAARVGGLVGSAVLLSGNPAGAFALDAACDFQKLQSLNEKIEALQSVVLDPMSSDLKKAKASLEFQENVYENIKTYTQIAATIKTAAAVSCFMAYLGALLTNHATVAKNPELAAHGTKILLGGATLGLIASLTAFGHYWTEEPALEKTNRKLANEFTQFQ